LQEGDDALHEIAVPSIMKNHNPFSDILKGRVVLFGVGNLLRGDDAAGPLLIERLRGKVQAICINAELAPDRYIGKIIQLQPDTLIIIDAVHLGTAPGSYMVLKPGQLEDTVSLSHDIPLRDLIEQIQREIDTEVYVLGIQPERTGIGDSLSPRVERALATIEELLL
jgi:hydrogenase 3 maturation protease